jgi:hypothetical protein
VRAILLCCLPPVVAVGIPAQTVHVVGPGALPEISSALAIAAAGDIVHVQPGTYAPFAVGIACTIRASTPGTVLVQSAAAAPSVTIAPPPGQTVHLVGVDFDADNGQGVAITAGRVTLDQCTLRSTGTPLSITNADVHLQGCTITSTHHVGFHAAMTANGARVTAIDSTFQGSPHAMGFYYVTSPGIDATNATLHAARCTIRSGVYGIQGPALRANGGQVWLSDSTVTAFIGCPIAATAMLADRCVVQPVYATCPLPASGGLLGVARAQPLQNGSPFSLTYTTIPNGYAVVFASQELASLTIPGLHAQTQWLGGGILNLGVVLADASGQATGTWNIPAGTWLVDQPLWFQGLTGFAFPLQLSPVAGGLIR